MFQNAKRRIFKPLVAIDEKNLELIIMKNILEKISSSKIINALNIFEIIFFCYLIVERIQIIVKFNKIDNGLRELITFMDYENGPAILFLVIAITGNIFFYKLKRICWITKMIVFFSLLFLLINSKHIVFILILLIFYYSLKKVRIFFELKEYSLIKLYLLPIIISLGLLIATSFLPIIEY